MSPNPQYYAYRWDSSSSFNGLWDDLSVSLRTSLNAAVMKRCLDKCPLFEDLSSAFIVSLSNVLADQVQFHSTETAHNSSHRALDR